MYGQYRKIDPAKVLKLKSQGLSCVQIARRLNVSVAAVSHVLRKAESGRSQREEDKR